MTERNCSSLLIIPNGRNYLTNLEYEQMGHGVRRVFALDCTHGLLRMDFGLNNQGADS
jgi:hypothetical protein